MTPESTKNIYAQLGTQSRWIESLPLRLAVASCFVGHGVLAYEASNNFGSEWHCWVRELFPQSLEYIGSTAFLKVVGAIDVIDGLLILLPRIPRSALCWVFFWGAMTTASRLFFLGVHIPPLEVNTLNAFAEFFKRAPNWIIPLLLVAMTSDGIERRFCILKNKLNWLHAAVGAQMLGIYLKSCHEVISPFFYFELEKIGMPQWFFWSVTIGSFLGILLMALAMKAPAAYRGLRFLSFVVPLTYFCNEGFLVYSKNLPGGFEFTVTRLISHASMYLSVTMWASLQIQPLVYRTKISLRSTT